MECIWKIRAPPGLKIAIWIRDFFLEQGTVYPPYCQDDFMYFNVSYFVFLNKSFIYLFFNLRTNIKFNIRQFLTQAFHINMHWHN